MPYLTTYTLEVKGHNFPTIQKVALKLYKSAPEFEADKLTFPQVVDDSDEKEQQDE